MISLMAYTVLIRLIRLIAIFTNSVIRTFHKNYELRTYTPKLFTIEGFTDQNFLQSNQNAHCCGKMSHNGSSKRTSERTNESGSDIHQYQYTIISDKSTHVWPKCYYSDARLNVMRHTEDDLSRKQQSAVVQSTITSTSSQTTHSARGLSVR